MTTAKRIKQIRERCEKYHTDDDTSFLLDIVEKQESALKIAMEYLNSSSAVLKLIKEVLK